MMSIFCTRLPSPISIPFPANHHSSLSCNLSGSILCSRNKKYFTMSAASVASTFFPDRVYSENELKEQGVTFTDIGDDCVVKMSLENGNSAKLMLPSGLITSFRAQMWHGGTVELLHTSVSSDQENATVIQGGLSLALALENEAGVSWSPNEWTLCQLKGDPEESVQLELINRNKEANVEVKHIITLGQDNLTSEIVVSNASTSSVRLMGSALSHLTLSTPDATYAIGLEGSDYFVRPPVMGDFSIVLPDSTDQDSGKFWSLDRLFSKGNQNASLVKDTSVREENEDLEGVEDDNYKHLKEELSIIYTSAPRNFTILDRGRRNSVSVKREGFNELYLFSPGSSHVFYGKYSYICIGHTALLEPIILNTQSEWRGGLQIWNPNY